MAITVAMRTQVSQLYVSLFGRAPDGEGLGFWVGALDSGKTIAQVAQEMYATAPARAYYPSFATNSEIIATFYQNVLGRAADAEGLAFWTAELNKAATKGEVFAKLIANVVDYTGTDAAGLKSQALLKNKVEVAQYYGEKNGTAAGATAVLAGVTDVATTVTAAKAIADGTSAAGQTFTLTTGIDSISGSTANDTFNTSLVFDATEVVTTTSTLSVPDVVVGGAGTDALNITISGAQDAAVTIPAAGISGVETFNVRNTVAQTATLDATNFAGLTAANNDRSVGALTVTGLTAAASGGVVGDGAVTNGASSFGWGATVTSGIVNISGGTVGTGVVTTSGTLLATQTVNSTGAANTIGALTLGAAVTTLNVNATTALTTGAVTNTGGAALTRINVTGSSAVSLSATALEATVTTIDASAATGALTVALGSAVTQTVTGGAGNDVITTGAVLTTGSVNAGAGTDVLVVGTNVAHVNTASLAAKYTNFETVRIGAAALDMSLIGGINAVQLTGAATLTNMTAAQAAAVTARANIGNASLALATATGTSDVLTITNGLGTTTAAATTIGTLVATGFETINLAANPGPSAAVGTDRTTTVTAITDTSLTAVNLTGTAFTFGDIASSKAVAWNASALTGNGASTPVGLTLTTTGAAFAGSTVTGSALRDSVVMDSSTGVTFNLGAGNDIFSTTSTLLLPSGAATDNTINAGEGATDRLVFTGAATLTDTSFTKTSGFEALELAGGAVDNSVTGLAAGFLTGFAGGVTVTDTASQAAAQAFTWASGLYSQPVTLTHTTAGTLGATSSNQSITTGAGADSITLTATSVVGAAGAAGNINVNTGAGNDTINVNIGTGQILAVTGTRLVTINGGAGQDAITVNATHVNNTAVNLGNVGFVVNAGESSTTAWDTITGFLKADGTGISDALDFSNVALTAYTAAAPTGYTAAQLTVAVSAAGAVTFAGTSASALTVAEKIAAVQSVVVTNNGDTAYFIDNGSTYVFNNETAGDVVVQLIGQTGATALITTNATTANAIFIV